MDLTGDAKPFVWVYKPLKDNADDFVTTELTLTNVNTADDGEVFIPLGTVTLKSANATKMFIAKLTVQAKDKLTVAGDGATNDAIGGDAAKLKNYISVAGNTKDNVNEADGTPFTLFEDKTTVALDEGTIVGAVTGTVENGVAHTTEKPNETNVAMADLPLINHMLTRVEMNDLRKRMGDIRLLEGETGTWARWEGGRLKGDNGLTNDFHKIQLGADTTTGIESLRLGASFSYTNGDMDFAKASAESDTLSFAGYGVWTADNGMFADVIARLAFIDTEIQTDKVKGELDNLAFSLSGEYGWRFDLCDQFFVEPQVELTYTYIDSDDFTSAGAKFDFDSSDSLIGRAGLAAGWKLPDDRGDLYARASVVQEFMGDGKLTASMGNTLRRYETDGDDTWFEYGIGANIKLNKNVYVFGDVERTEGAEIDEEWRGTVGLRYSF
ncbi:MAG: autotransporter outer membrane beta-barrel domain-containing protein [Mailhella sp.]|nr:autotransporter outer membrane beta-barrel domain-containing protein [Mailhella sp.]